MFKTLTVILAALIIARIGLPYALLSYAENKINQIPGYHVKIGDLDVHLWRGSYTLKNISLINNNKTIPVPFFSAKALDLSVQWRALLHGSFVAKLTATDPIINFVIDPQGKNEQLSINQEWEKAVKALFPLNFNRLETINGELYLRSYSAKPPFKLYLKNVNLLITNMQKITKEENLLSSTFRATAKSMDGADAAIHGKFNPFAKQPTFYLNGSLQSMSIKEANNFLRHYTAADVKQGRFSLYVEAAAAKGKIKGYAKPIIKDLKILDMSKETNPIEALYKGALEIVSKIVTNPRKQTIATRVNIVGDIDDPDTSILSIIGNVLSHAFIQALLPQVDHTIQMRDVLISSRKA